MVVSYPNWAPIPVSNPLGGLVEGFHNAYQRGSQMRDQQEMAGEIGEYTDWLRGQLGLPQQSNLAGLAAAGPLGPQQSQGGQPGSFLQSLVAGGPQQPQGMAQAAGQQPRNGSRRRVPGPSTSKAPAMRDGRTGTS